MRFFLIVCSLVYCLFLVPSIYHANMEMEDLTYILEVKETPEKVVTYIKRHYPRVQILETYDTLLNGVAVKGKESDIYQLQMESFVHAASESFIYEAIGKMTTFSEMKSLQNMYIPNMLNDTPYTGKDVKIGVVDTGIDMDHEDLQQSYQGGADVVDFQDEPRETEEGLGKTMHGTHVAGIIAANGMLQGVAPNSEIYAYRALGEGGFGTSVQVIAAMEKAIQDGVDIINLSLGNTTNVPDYATSKAVNEASKRGIIVVVANGNDGPNDWTIGAPATASTALSVGAYAHPMKKVYLYDALTKEKLSITPLTGQEFWYREQQTHYMTKEIMNNDMLYIDEAEEDIEEILQVASNKASAILIDEKVVPYIDGQLLEDLSIPLAIISKDLPEKWLHDNKKYLIELKVEQSKEGVAPFSSRGPVALNWQMKPDILAPGVNILSTIPDGYDALNGTSMAAPHIAGAVAVMKEAQPMWSNEQIIGALKTTAKKMTQDITPIEQGTGLVQLNEAIHTNIIIDNPMLSFGKMHRFIEERTIPLMIENVGNESETFHFDIPSKERGITWDLPQIFTINPGERKEVAVTLKLNTTKTKEGIHQGFITLSSKTKRFDIPYLYVHNNTSNKKVEQFTIGMESTSSNTFSYTFYATEKVKQLDVQLLNVENMILEQNVLSLENISIGENNGVIQLKDINLTNRYVFVFIIQLENGRVLREYVDL